MELVLIILFLGGVVVICAPVFDSGEGCGIIALMFLISIVIMAGLVFLTFFLLIEEYFLIGIGVLIIGIILANRLMALFFD